MTILVFDSGIGGLTILREARAIMAEQRFVYIGDDLGFPYGEWQEDALVERMTGLFEHYLARYQPSLAIVACNTASTLIMPALRSRFSIPFVGTVPPIKPAAERTRSGLVTVLATPGTVNRQYTRDLIDEFAADVEVNLVGATSLARQAEAYMQGVAVDADALMDELRPCFIERDGRRTDIVVLGCTHYPFLVNEMRKRAPWPVDWIDPSEAIARHARSLIGEHPSKVNLEDDVAIMTSGAPGNAVHRLLKGFGFHLRDSGAPGLGSAGRPPAHD